MSAAPRLLVVDDNAVDRERVRRLLGPEFPAIEAATAAEALESARPPAVDCVLLDYRLPDVDGLRALDALVERGLPVVMLTGQGDERIAVEAMKRGAQDYLLKVELSGAALRRSIERAVENARLRRRVEAQRVELERQLAELEAQRARLSEANRALGEREAKLRLILGQLPAMVWTTDRELRCASVAGSAGPLEIDVAAARGRPISELLDGFEREDVRKAHEVALAGAHGAFQLERGGRTFKGRTEPLRDGDDVGGVIGVALDVSETHHLEQQLRHAQKMEALGQLAGGVAHDFNNLLTVIVSFTEFAREQVTRDGPVRADLDEVLSAASRGADLVRKLLAFSRRRIERPRHVDVSRLVEELCPMLRRLVGEDVDVGLHLAEDLAPTFVEPGGVEQIVMNLAVNARDAMPAGGRLTISTREVELDEELDLTGRAGLEPGSYVVLEVTDEGDGIPPDVLERIFDPFFTTKDVGEGSGLGLATCYGIARKADGGIGVYSEPGVGTTFRVYLRARRDSMPTPEAPASRPIAGDERILVIEDDAQVLRAVLRTLRAQGYDVISATSPEEALSVVSREGSSIALVLSDVVMPQGSGPALVARLRDHLADARVLFMSGYADGALRRRELLAPDQPVLEKPFTAAQLTRAVRSVLDDRTEGNR